MIDILTPFTDYALTVAGRVPGYLDELEAYTQANHSGAQMLSGPYQGRLLAFISRVIRPKNILEIGTYTGYSALCLAEGLAPDGMLHSVEIDHKLNETQQLFFNKSPFADQIRVYFGDAKSVIPNLDIAPELVFMDGAKKDYAFLYSLCLQKMKSGSVLLIDNVLWRGEVMQEEPEEPNGKILQEFNEMIAADDRVEKIILPVRDGVFWIMKK